jgi:hypothetical protein
MGKEEYRMNKRLLKQIRAQKKAASGSIDQPQYLEKPTLLF